MPDLSPFLASLGEVSASATPDAARGWADAELLTTQRALADARRRLETVAAVVAGEIAHRSRRELGHAGLAAASGQRSAEELISTLTGTSTRDARTLVRAAELLPTPEPRPADGEASDAAATPPRPNWLRALGRAVSSATLSTQQVKVIRSRLGAVTGAAELSASGPGEHAIELDSALTAAAERLIAEAGHLTVEQLAGRAARARDDLDLAGIAVRETALHQKRYLRVSTQLDGMTRVTGLLDPESAAIVVPIFDAATSPRRGGPRFVDPDAVARAEDIVRDERSAEQLALDVFVELMRIGARVDDGKLLGDRKPAVRILVTRADLEAPVGADGDRTGAAFFEGQTDAVSIATAERYICSSGAVPIVFDTDGRVLNLGREQRLFSEKQRVAMAARDGGCLMCGAPPSWSEAHHIDHWHEHHGLTNIDDGVLLCRFCHLNVHNNTWRIRREHGQYFLERPDHNGTPRPTPLTRRSPALQRLLSA
jgi:hypothetical protein